MMTMLFQTVKTVDSSETNTKAIDSWIKSIADLHRTQPAPTVHYSKYEYFRVAGFPIVIMENPSDSTDALKKHPKMTCHESAFSP